MHERVHDAFLDEVLKAAAEWRLGDPFDDTTRDDPMNNSRPPPRDRTAISRTHSTRGERGPPAARARGDRPTSLYYEPTVVTDVGVDT